MPEAYHDKKGLPYQLHLRLSDTVSPVLFFIHDIILQNFLLSFSFQDLPHLFNRDAALLCDLGLRSAAAGKTENLLCDL